MLIVLLELAKEILFLSHDFRFFDRAKSLIHGTDVARGKVILYPSRFLHAAAKGTQECIDHPPHNARNDDRRERIGGDQHQPDRQCRNDLGEKLKGWNQYVGKNNNAAAVDISQKSRGIMIEMKEIGFCEVVGHQFLRKVNLIGQREIDLQAQLPCEIDVL